MCSGFAQQTAREKDVLAKLFSSSSSVLPPMVFDPMAESTNFESQRKKKSVIIPVTRDVVLFSVVPHHREASKRL